MAHQLTGKTIASTYEQLIYRTTTVPSTGTTTTQLMTSEADQTDDIGTALYIGTERIGINNATPGNQLEISAVSGPATLELSSWSATATAAHAGKIVFQKSGTATVNTFTGGDHTTAGEILGRIEAWGVNDSDNATLSAVNWFLSFIA